MNAYLLFAKEVKIAVLKENPTATQEDIDMIVHQKWRYVLTSEEKRPYFDRAEKLRRDAANKLQRKRDRARVAAFSSALPPAEASSVAESTNASECGNVMSAPSSPDSGCPSTPEGENASSSTSSPICSSRRECKTGSKSAPSNHHLHQGIRPLPNASSSANLIPAASTIPSVLAGIPVAHGTQQFAYHPMVPHMIQPAFPLPYLHPLFFPPPPMLASQMQSFLASHGINQPGFAPSDVHPYGNCVGSQMVPPQPYYTTHVQPMYPPQQQQLQPHSGFYPVPAASTPLMKVSDALDDLGYGDANRICNLTIYDEDDKSEYSINDGSYEPPDKSVTCE